MLLNRLAYVSLAAAVGCAAAPMYGGGAGSGGGGGASGGATGAGGTGATGAGGAPPRGSSGLPIPPGAGDVPLPSGTPGNLKVLHWAGFKSALTYTFDDGQPSQVEHYADLQAMGVPLTFYVTSSSVSSSSAFDATFSQAVRDGHEIGNHTVHHCQANLTNCGNSSATSLDAELDDCTSYIIGHFGQSAVWTAASPYGDTGYDAADATRFLINRGVQSGTIGPNDATDPYNLPCYAAVEADTVGNFNNQIDGAESGGRWLVFLIHTLNPTSNVWYAPIDISVVTGSVAHALSLGDVWIDAAVNVGAYWRAEKIVSAATPAASGGAMTWTWTLPAHFPTGRALRITVDGGTVSQNGKLVPWDGHGYFEIALDAQSLTVSP